MSILLLLELFGVFFIIGLFTFGGGHAMIPLIQSEVVSRGWLSAEQVLNFIAISESTPGPFAINMATFIGASQQGIFGAIFATLGVVLPSFIIIYIIARLFHHFMDNRFVKALLKGAQPVVVGLLLAAAVLIGASYLFPNWQTTLTFNRTGFVLMVNLALIYYGYQFVFKKKLSPLILIVIGGIVGMIAFAI